MNGSKLLYGLGAGLFGLGCSLVWVQFSDPNAPSKMYALFGFSAFLIMVGLCWMGYAGTEFAERVISLWHTHAMNAHARKLMASPKAVQTPTDSKKPATTDATYAEEYRVHYHKFFTYARDCGGIQFERVKAFFGDKTRRAEAHIAWRELLTPFIRAHIIAPIQPGKPTDFETGYSVDWVIGRLDNGRLPEAFQRYIPAYPPPAPFTTPDRETQTITETPGTQNNSGETPITQGNSVYARDV